MLTNKQGSASSVYSCSHTNRAPSRRMSSPSLPSPRGHPLRQPPRSGPRSYIKDNHDESTSTSTSTSASASKSAFARFAVPLSRMPRLIQRSLHLPTQSIPFQRPLALCGIIPRLQHNPYGTVSAKLPPSLSKHLGIQQTGPVPPQRCPPSTLQVQSSPVGPAPAAGRDCSA